MSIYLRMEGQPKGPFTSEEVQAWLERKLITAQTPAWQVGWPAWRTVAEALQPSASSGVPASGPPIPPPLPAAEPKPPPPYTTTLVLAVALFGIDGLIVGMGGWSVFVLLIGVPVLVIRALMAWHNPALRWRRFGSAGIYAAAALATLALVRFDRTGALARAERVIAACEEFKQANGDYPKALAELTPRFLTAIPHARQVGTAPKEFTYFLAGPGRFVKGTNGHVLSYMSLPPFGNTYYVFEEQRWGFYD